jgi:hypothetical protein
LRGVCFVADVDETVDRLDARVEELTIGEFVLLFRGCIVAVKFERTNLDAFETTPCMHLSAESVGIDSLKSG